MQNLTNKIKFDDLEKIELTCTIEVLKNCTEIGHIFAQSIGLNFNGLLIFLGMKNGKYTVDQYKKASEYYLIEKDIEKKLFLGKNGDISLEIINDIKEEKEAIAKNLLNISDKLREFIASDLKIFDKIINILVLALEEDDTKEEKEKLFKILKKTDVYVLTELFIRTFKKPEQDFSKAFFLSLFVDQFKTKIQSSKYFQIAKKLF